MPKVFQLRHSAHPLSNKHRPAWRLCFFLLCHRSLLSVLSLGTVSVWGVGATVLHVVWVVPKSASTGSLYECKSEVLVNIEIVKDKNN
jgi:hypothetical protein